MNKVYNQTPPTLQNGKVSQELECDINGNLRQTLSTLIAGEDLANNVQKTEQRYSYNNISTATTTVVKSGAGFLHAISINTSAAGTITIYDNTAGSGTKIATLAASVTGPTYIYNVSFGTGLTIVTAAASDLTISYR